MNHPSTLRHSKSHRAKVISSHSSAARMARLRRRPHGTVEGDYSPWPREDQPWGPPNKRWWTGDRADIEAQPER